MTGTNAFISTTESVHFDLSTSPLSGNYTKTRISKHYYYQVLPYSKFLTSTALSQSQNI